MNIFKDNILSAAVDGLNWRVSVEAVAMCSLWFYVYEQVEVVDTAF